MLCKPAPKIQDLIRSLDDAEWQGSLYDLLRTQTRSRRGELGLGERAVLGMVAGGAAQWAASPADLIKVRMQMEGRRRLQVSCCSCSCCSDPL